MIIKLPVISNNKIIYLLFKLTAQSPNQILCSLYQPEYCVDLFDKNTIKILTCNENGIKYHNIHLPLKIFIIDSFYFTIYFFIINLSSNFTNKLDFFYCLNNLLVDKFKYSHINKPWTIKLNNYIIETLNTEYNNCNELSIEINDIILNYSGFIIMMNNLFQKNLINKKILLILNNIKKINYSINYSNSYNVMDHLKNIKNKQINLKDIKENLYYFLLIEENKIIHIKVNKIVSKLIYVNNITQPIQFEKYKWFIYPPDIKITINKIFFLLLNNYKNLGEIQKLDLIELHNTNYLNELMSNYIFPFKYNKKEIDKNFDLILYHSFINIHNGSNFTGHIPNKLKSTYNNIIKIFNLLISDESIKNKIHFTDILPLQIFKIIFLSNSLIYNLLQKLVSSDKIVELKNELENIIIIYDILCKLSWKNINRKLDYLNILFQNKEYINKNLLNENFDQRIKSIVLNPFEMFKYLRREIDFIKWIIFLENKYVDLYIVPISFCSNDFKILGKIIYSLFHIKEQNFNDNFYKKILYYGINFPKVILDNSRINLKIKECFNHLKCNINLGILAKHLSQNKNNIIEFEEPPDKEKELLKENLIKITKKYLKYKKKYYEVVKIH
jgi:hypothetical protein